MSEIAYSRGRSKTDNYPQRRTAPDFAAFVDALDLDRSPSKGGAYVAGPFNGDGRRCAEGALARRFLPLDLDRIDVELAEVRLWCGRFSACAWPTHRSTPAAPRERIIIELARDADRNECITLGKVLARDLAEHFGDAIEFDPSTIRPDQASYTPPVGVAIARFDGPPLDVDAYLANAPETPERDERGDDDAEDLLGRVERGERLHDALARLIARWAAKGMDEATVRAAACGLLERARRTRGDRVDEIAGAELDRLIAGAFKKYAPAQSELPTRLDLRALARTEPAPPAFVVRDWLPQAEVTLYSGHGGSGKSAIALHLAVCVALGRDWLGIPTQRRRVRFVSLEDPAAVLHWRLARICAWLGVDMAELADWLSIDDGANTDAALMVETREGAALTHVYEWLASTIGDSEVLMLDGASDAFAANENARAHVRAFIRAIRRLIPPTGAALLLAHVNALTARNPATSQGFSGSTAWHNSARARWYLHHDDDGLLLEVQKSNHGPTGQSMRLHWNDAAHLFLGELAMPATKLERSLADADDRETILRLIRDAYEAGNPVPAASSGSRTSWHVLATHPDFPESLKAKDGRRRTLAHIETLRTAGAIRADTMRDGYRNTREVLRAP